MAPAFRRYVSPLRYPGGKARITGLMHAMLGLQPPEVQVWLEPFAGGGGVGLGLLDAGEIEQLYLVEKHPPLAAFWQVCASPEGEHLADMVAATAPNLDTWYRAKQLVAEPQGCDPVLLAWAAFVVNRCSRSGIITEAAGPIGGKHQAGRWKVADRFNPSALADRIRHVCRLGAGGGIHVHQGQAAEYVEALSGSGLEAEVFVFADPPYLVQGNRLYGQGMSAGDHVRLARALRACPSPWVATYDNDPRVAGELYPDNRVIPFELGYSAARRRRQSELMVLGDNVPGIEGVGNAAGGPLAVA